MQALIDIPLIGPLVGTLLPFFLVLGLVIFVHEYGHYIVGRWCGIESDAFSIGFGPEAMGWTDKRGTRWKLSWIPLGGYVKFKGDANPASGPDDPAIRALAPEDRRKTLNGAPIWARALTVLAGPVSNFLFTIVVLSVVGLAAGKVSNAPVMGVVAPGGQASSSGFEAGDTILSVNGVAIESFSAFQQAILTEEDESKAVEVLRAGEELTLQATFSRPSRVSFVAPGSPAEAACMKPGDVILALDGQPIGSFKQIQDAVADSGGRALTLTVQRGTDLKEISVAPREIEQPDPATGEVVRKLLMGVTADFNLGMGPTMEPMGVGEAILFGLEGPWRLAKSTFGYLGSWAFGDADGSSIGGPIGIASASSQAAQSGILGFFGFVAILSTAIGLINLFPIPILDGGHLVFYGLEAIRGKPLGERAVDIAMKIGFGLVLLLMVYATSNDLTRLVNGWFAAC